MTREELQKAYNQIDDLYDEFISKWRKNDFRFKTEYNANNKRVAEIINTVVRIIKHNKMLSDFIFEDKNEDYKTYMEVTGFYVESVFYGYASKLLRRIEEQLKELPDSSDVNNS